MKSIIHILKVFKLPIFTNFAFFAALIKWIEIISGLFLDIVHDKGVILFDKIVYV